MGFSNRVFCGTVILFATFFSSSAYDDLSENKTTAQSTTYLCRGYGYCLQFYSSSAVDRNKSTCMRPRPIGAYYIERTVWWYVDLGGISSIYSVRILFKLYHEGYVLRQRGRFAGFSLYISNTTKKEDGSLCYKDGPDLPPLDFNTTCVGNARYVIFYNERLPEVVYPKEYAMSSFTELCEVIVLGCLKEGVYGVDCDLQCPENCQEKRCNIVNGTCLGCRPGWIGEFCDTKCLTEYYGLQCEYTCSGNCMDGVTCNQVTGQCDNGCKSGWTGRQCNETCKAGKYGQNCSAYCSVNCLNNDPCNKTDGHCDLGCLPGFTGDLCNKVCSAGTFEYDCVNICRSQCIHNETCSPSSGLCENGCSPGYYGPQCRKVCPDGTFGNNCSETCSRNCIGICSHVDGSCNCVPSYTGSPNCTTECPQGSYGINCQYRCSGHCLHDETCSKFDGSCSQGCKDQYIGVACDFRNDTSLSASTIGLAIVVVILIILLIAVSVFFKRQHHCVSSERRSLQADQMDKDNVKIQTLSTKDLSFSYQDLNVSDMNNTYETVDLSDTFCAYQNLDFTG